MDQERPQDQEGSIQMASQGLGGERGTLLWTIFPGAGGTLGQSRQGLAPNPLRLFVATCPLLSSNVFQ